MMKYRKIEVAILSAKRERNLQRMEDIKMILEHKTRILDMEADQTMKRSGFKRQMRPKSEPTVQRLHRLTQAYAWS